MVSQCLERKDMKRYDVTGPENALDTQTLNYPERQPRWHSQENIHQQTCILTSHLYIYHESHCHFSLGRY